MKVLLTQAIYDYGGELEGYEDRTLSFSRDALICVTLAKESGWWKGFLLSDVAQEVGWFPSNYVSTVSQSPILLDDRTVSQFNRSDFRP